MIETLIVVSVVGFVMLAFSVFSLGVSSSMRRTRLIETVDLVRMEILVHLSDSIAWGRTFGAAENAEVFRCLLEDVACPPAPKSFVLKNRNGQTVYNALDPAAGFNVDGQICSTFNDASDDSTCIFRLELDWDDVCSVDCSPPVISVTGRFRVKLQSYLTLNPDRWTFAATQVLNPFGGCPENFVPVPGRAAYGTSEFCVAKYEMKIKGIADGRITYDATYVAESRPSGNPWTKIIGTEASAECKALGMGYDLISNDQWMTLAADIENVSWNWGDGIGGALGMSQGHTDGVPNLPLSAGADSYPCTGTGGSCSLRQWNWQRRVHKLSNGYYVWDVGGNAMELIRFKVPFSPGLAEWTTGAQIARLNDTVPDYTDGHRHVGPSRIYDPAAINDAWVINKGYGLGLSKIQDDPDHTIHVRGIDGVFGIQSVKPDTRFSNGGFRCVYLKPQESE